MRATLEAIEAAVDAVVAAAWLSSADAGAARAGRGWRRDGSNGEGPFGGGFDDDDDATTRENDALRGAFSAGAVGAPFKTLVVAAGAIDAAAVILRGDAMNLTDDKLSDDKLSDDQLSDEIHRPVASRGASEKFADVAREMSLLVERFAPALARLVNAEPTAVTPGSPLAFLAERHPHRVPFAAKFKLLQREIRASRSARGLRCSTGPSTWRFRGRIRLAVSTTSSTGYRPASRRSAAARPPPTAASAREAGSVSCARGPGRRLIRTPSTGASTGRSPPPRSFGRGSPLPPGSSARTIHPGRSTRIAAPEVSFPRRFRGSPPWIRRRRRPGRTRTRRTPLPCAASSSTRPFAASSETAPAWSARRFSSPPPRFCATEIARCSARGPPARLTFLQPAAAFGTTSTRRAPSVTRRRRGASSAGSWACASRPGATFACRWCRGCGISCCTARTGAWLVRKTLGTSRASSTRRIGSWARNSARWPTACEPPPTAGGRLRWKSTSRRVGRAAGDLADRGGEGEAREARREDGCEVASRRLDRRKPRGKGEFEEPEEPQEEEEEEGDRATCLGTLERVLSIAPGPHGDAAALRWLDSMAEAEPEFHRSLVNLLRHPIASERNAWAVNMLTFTRDASTAGESNPPGENEPGPGRERRTGTGTRTVELIPGGEHVEVTDANKARYVAALVRHRATTVRGASTLRAVRLMREGLDDVVPLRSLRAFSPDDLRRLVCGVDELRPEAWRAATRHTDFGAWSASASVQGASPASWETETWRAAGRAASRPSFIGFGDASEVSTPTGEGRCCSFGRERRRWGRRGSPGASFVSRWRDTSGRSRCRSRRRARGPSSWRSTGRLSSCGGS